MLRDKLCCIATSDAFLLALVVLALCALTGCQSLTPDQVAALDQALESGAISQEQYEAIRGDPNAIGGILEGLIGAGVTLLLGLFGLRTPVGANFVARAVNRSSVPSRSAQG